jgi:hypothetical protein
MPTPDASQFTQLKKFGAIAARRTAGEPQSRTLTHLYQTVPSVTQPVDFLSSFSNKFTTLTLQPKINTVTGSQYKPRVPGGNVWGTR